VTRVGTRMDSDSMSAGAKANRNGIQNIRDRTAARIAKCCDFVDVDRKANHRCRIW